MIENDAPVPKHVPLHRPGPLPEEFYKTLEAISGDSTRKVETTEKASQVTEWPHFYHLKDSSFGIESRSLFLALMLSNYVCSPIECLYAGMIIHKVMCFNNLYPMLELHKFTFSLPCLLFTVDIKPSHGWTLEWAILNLIFLPSKYKLYNFALIRRIDDDQICRRRVWESYHNCFDMYCLGILSIWLRNCYLTYLGFHLFKGFVYYDEAMNLTTQF